MIFKSDIVVSITVVVFRQAFLIVVTSEWFCASCIALWLAHRVVGGIELAGGLSVDWVAFCSL